MRLLNAVVERMDITNITRSYSRLGRITYPPRILLKILLYAYMRHIYSSREIERVCRENIHFMYLPEGYPPPDHNTICRFRSKYLAGHEKELLEQMTALPVEWGFVTPEAEIRHLKKLRKKLYEKRQNGNYISAVRNDVHTLIPFMEYLKRYKKIRNVVVDPGYESEENYCYFETTPFYSETRSGRGRPFWRRTSTVPPRASNQALRAGSIFRTSRNTFSPRPFSSKNVSSAPATTRYLLS